MMSFDASVSSDEGEGARQQTGKTVPLINTEPPLSGKSGPKEKSVSKKKMCLGEKTSQRAGMVESRVKVIKYVLMVSRSPFLLLPPVARAVGPDG
jgi:hypothetical protein